MVTGNHSDKMGDETWEVGLYEGLGGRQFHAGRFLHRFTVAVEFSRNYRIVCTCFETGTSVCFCQRSF